MIAISGYGQEEDLRLAKEAGFDHHLVKPIASDDLIKLLEESESMSRDRTLARILECGIVAVVRAETSEPLVKVAKALAEGGVTAIEVTFTVPGRHRRDPPGAPGTRRLDRLGAGTVLDPETARAAILAGAEYIVAPTVNHEVIRLCRRYDKAVMPGALTPTEVLSAWESGADIVKIFPADVGGPAYLKALHGPLPQIRTDAHRRRRSDHRRELPEGGRLLPGRRQRARRAQSRRRRRLRPDSRPGSPVLRDRSRRCRS